MTNTPHLGLPLIAAAQAQKHVTHNEALLVLDALAQLAVVSASVAAPPALPAEGDRYIVPAAATGVWAGQAGKVAAFYDGAWHFLAPEVGWTAFNQATGSVLRWTGSAWTEAGGSPGAAASFGVNTTADATNRLAVKSNAVLFSHDDVTPGSGDLRLSLNKSLPAKDAGLVLQSGFSTRVLFGLLGDDNLTLKVSADGAAFTDVLSASAASGIVSNLKVQDSTFQIRDNVDATKIALFDVAALPTATTRTYSLPNASGGLATVANFTQVFSGTTTFSAATATFGSATAASTYGIGTGATVASATKAINIGTSGLANSVTNVTIGSAVAGALGTTTVHTPTVTFASTVTAFSATAANASFLGVGLGGASADATNRLAANTPGALFNHAGTDITVTLNKAAAANDARLAFQSGFSARALFGLLGGDDFVVKVTPDGSTYRTALVIDRAQGTPSFPEASKFSAYVNFDKYVPADTWTNLGCNTARHNDQADFAAATGRFTAPVAGIYRFHGRYRFKANTALPTQVLLRFSKNGSLTAGSPDQPFANSAGPLVSLATTVALQADMKLAAGDTVEMQALFSGADGYVEANANTFEGSLVP